jgi:hypothetical protein
LERESKSLGLLEFWSPHLRVTRDALEDIASPHNEAARVPEARSPTVAGFVKPALFALLQMARAVLVFALCAAAVSAQTYVGSVTLAAGTYSFVPGAKVAGAVAVGSVSTMNSSASGFAELSIVTSSAFSDAQQMFAAGFLEGALTQPQIYLHSINMLAWIAGNFGGKPPPPEYEAFFTAQDAWARGNVASNATVRWAGMGLILSQFDGLRAGYAAVAPSDQALSLYTFQQMNAVGDLLDLIPALQPGSPHAAPWNWETQTTEMILGRARKINHCSGLFAVTGNLSDVFWGHSAWFTYMGTNRVFKHYKFSLASPGMVGAAMSFSSYPAYLSSLDDFYITWSTKLVMVETTNGIYNKSLYKLIVPESLFAWQRVRLANLVSPDGPTWGDVMAWHNSGTYNNAYGVLSLADWTPGEALPPNFLTYVEQIPGLVYYGDVTRELEKGHMPMYNVPFVSGGWGWGEQLFPTAGGDKFALPSFYRPPALTFFLAVAYHL